MTDDKIEGLEQMNILEEELKYFRNMHNNNDDDDETGEIAELKQYMYQLLEFNKIEEIIGFYNVTKKNNRIILNQLETDISTFKSVDDLKVRVVSSVIDILIFKKFQ